MDVYGSFHNSMDLTPNNQPSVIPPAFAVKERLSLRSDGKGKIPAFNIVHGHATIVSDGKGKVVITISAT